MRRKDTIERLIEEDLTEAERANLIKRYTHEFLFGDKDE